MEDSIYIIKRLYKDYTNKYLGKIILASTLYKNMAGSITLRKFEANNKNFEIRFTLTTNPPKTAL